MSSQYDGNVKKNSAKCGKRLRSQMSLDIFDAFDPIYVIRFLSAFTFTCNTDEGHEGAALCLFHVFTKRSCAAALNARLCLKPAASLNTRREEEEGMFTTYPVVVDYFL